MSIFYDYDRLRQSQHIKYIFNIPYATVQRSSFADIAYPQILSWRTDTETDSE